MEVFRINLALAEEAEKVTGAASPYHAAPPPFHPTSQPHQATPLSQPCLTTEQQMAAGSMLPSQTYQILTHHMTGRNNQQGCQPNLQQSCQPNLHPGCQQAPMTPQGCQGWN